MRASREPIKSPALTAGSAGRRFKTSGTEIDPLGMRWLYSGG
jgi:hypothetical protein